jgi:peptide/nickel transport system substrate-binding protein
MNLLKRSPSKEEDLLNSRKRLLKFFAPLCALAIVAAACGGSNNGSNGNNGNNGGGPKSTGINTTATGSSILGGTKVTKGGVMRWASIGDTDYIDPAAAYTVTYFSTVGHGTVRSLTTYGIGTNFKEQNTAVPDLATSLGQHNANNTKWTYTLKDGIKYGPGMGGKNIPGVTGQAITSKDFKYAVERLFLPSVGAGYPFYYTSIKGATAFQKANQNGGPMKGQISGIQTPNDKTIVFNLTAPSGDWDYRMAMPAMSPVPQRYAGPLDAQKTSGFAQAPVAEGPYYIDSYTPKESMVLKPNPDWVQSTDNTRQQNYKEIDWKQGFDAQVCAQKVLSNQYDMEVDCQPTGAQLQNVVSNASEKARLFNGPEPCTGSLFMSTKEKPFDNIKVRQAVNDAIDRQNLIRLLGGPLVGDIAGSILPPTFVGNGFAGSTYFPFGNPNGTPDVAAAKKLMAETPYKNGFHGKLLVVGDSSAPVPQQFESIRQDLKAIGIDNLDIKTLPYPDYYTNYVGIPAKHVALGLTNWCQDFPSPTSFITPLFAGSSILSQGNSNYPLLNDPTVNSLIDKASGETGSAAAADWLKLNKMITNLAVYVPYRWYKCRIPISTRVQNAYYHSYYEQIDWVNTGVSGS